MCMLVAVLATLAFIWFPQYAWQLVGTIALMLITALFLKAYALAKKEGKIK